MSDIYNKNNNINHSNNNRVIQGVHIKKRTHNDVMNMNAFEHQIHRQNIEYKFDPRPVVTRYVKNPSTIQGPLFEVQNASQEKHLSFLPNSKTGTFHGYARNVDSETVLRNQTFALQKCDQAQYIPDSSSDLYNPTLMNRSAPINHPLLFKVHEPSPGTHAVPKHTGIDMFYNHTRVQRNN
jgi:hypothetical protein